MLRTTIAVLVILAVVLHYREKEDVPTICVALVAGSLIGQVFIASKGNGLPLLRAWLIGGSLAAFVYPLDFVKTGAYDVPSGMSYVAAFVGCLIAGLWSLSEGRSFWIGSRDVANPNDGEGG